MDATLTVNLYKNGKVEIEMHISATVETAWNIRDTFKRLLQALAGKPERGKEPWSPEQGGM